MQIHLSFTFPPRILVAFYDSTFYVLFTINVLHFYTVSILRPMKNGWDINKIMDIFSKRDVVKIMQISRSMTVRSDSWILLDDDKSTCTVKSRYKHLIGGFC